MTNRVNTIDDTVDSHTQRISSLDEEIDGKADTGTVTQLTSKVSTLEQNVNGFQATVESTYATKQALEDLSIGTRNYLNNSEYFDRNKDPYTASTCTVTSSKKDEYVAYNINPSKKIVVTFPALETGKEYIFSYDWCRPWASAVLVTTIGSTTNNVNTTNDQKWHRNVIKFTAASNTIKAEITFSTSQTYGEIYVRHF